MMQGLLPTDLYQQYSVTLIRPSGGGTFNLYISA